MHFTIEQLKERVPLRAVLEHYGHTGLPERNGKHFTCVFPENHANGDARPSCNFTTGKDGFPRYHCFSCGASGDQFDYVEQREGVNTAEAKKIVAGFGGIEEGGTYTATRKPVVRVTVPKKAEPMVLPSDLRRGTEDEWRALADLRKIDVHGVFLAVCSDILCFGTHRGKDCWIITDRARIVAEARRMDGEPFPHSGKKPDTIKNGKKSWPVGIRPRHNRPELFRKIVVVEGSPDLLAAYHFNYTLGKMDCLPVAMLGRECRSIHEEGLPLFRGRHVRIFPHIDPDG
ncbi:MAG: CHC2 zinc finger domain-containing protein, partial [Verrucomicrobiales bacterium]|nr:CHC2 zinc finger domain-containing protein [Verrucomicrobiales bacterium]